MAIITTDVTDFSAIQPARYPSAGKYLVGIDVDGKLKFMDSDGNIFETGGGKFTETTDFSAIQPADYPEAGEFLVDVDTADGVLKKMDSDGNVEDIGASVKYQVAKILTDIPYVHYETDIPGSKSIEAIEFFNGKYYAVVSNDIYESTDLETWTVNFIMGLPGYGATVFNNTLIVGSINTIAYTSDGISWTEVTVGDNNVYWKQFAVFNGELYAAGDQGVPTGGNVIAKSSDGASWTLTGTGDGTKSIKGIASSGTEIIAIGTDDMYVSTNGSTWSKSSNVSTAIPFGVINIVYGDNKYVVHSSGGTIGAGSSVFFTDYNDVINATRPMREYGNPMPHSCIPPMRYLNGKFYVTTDGHSGYMTVATSDDAIDWTVYQTAETGQGMGVYALCHDGTNAVAITKYPSDLLTTSSKYRVLKLDELTDTLVEQTFDLFRREATYSGNFVIVSEDGNEIIVQKEAVYDLTSQKLEVLTPQFGTTSKKWTAIREFSSARIIEKPHDATYGRDLTLVMYNCQLDTPTTIPITGDIAYNPSFVKYAFWQQSGGTTGYILEELPGYKVKVVTRTRFYKFNNEI